MSAQQPCDFCGRTQSLTVRQSLEGPAVRVTECPACGAPVAHEEEDILQAYLSMLGIVTICTVPR